MKYKIKGLCVIFELKETSNENGNLQYTVSTTFERSLDKLTKHEKAMLREMKAPFVRKIDDAINQIKIANSRIDKTNDNVNKLEEAEVKTKENTKQLKKLNALLKKNQSLKKTAEVTKTEVEGDMPTKISESVQIKNRQALANRLITEYIAGKKWQRQFRTDNGWGRKQMVIETNGLTINCNINLDWSGENNE